MKLSEIKAVFHNTDNPPDLVMLQRLLIEISIIQVETLNKIDKGWQDIEDAMKSAEVQRLKEKQNAQTKEHAVNLRANMGKR